MPATTQPAARQHVLTVSVEEYFHGRALSRVVLEKHWDRFEPRLDRSVDAALELLHRHGARATFFVLGVLAERNPGVVARIAAAGHEVGSRGHWPRPVAGLARAELAADLAQSRAAIEAASGREVLGYRAPRWITRKELWIHDLLVEQGYRYDASLCPTGFTVAGLPELATVHARAGAPFHVVPVSSLAVLGWRLPVGNGWRRLPAWVVERGLARLARGAAPLVCDFTSWELDREQPQVTALSRRDHARQYGNLGRASERLDALLARHRFGTVAEHLGLAAEPVAAPPRAAPAPARAPAPATAARQAVSIVVPIFDEQDNVAYLLRTLAALQERLAACYDLEFVLVDDGSRDASWERLQAACADRPGFRLLRHERNLGVARAIMTGVRAASADVAASIDCDCSYDPLDLERMLPMLPGADLVTASPYHPDGQVLNVPRWRLFLSRTLSRIYRVVLGKPLYTWTSCFRVYRVAAVRDLPVERGGFLGVAELLVRLLRRGGVVREYPTLLESRLLGVSKMKTLRTIAGHLALLWRIAWRRVG